MRSRRVVQVLMVLGLLVGACSGGGDDETTDTTDAPTETTELDVEPIVDVEPCDLLDQAKAAALAGAEVKEPEAVVEDDGSTSCNFEFADEDVADEAGSAIAASLSIAPGNEDDVPGGSLARSLDMGDASAVVEEESQVQVVYVIQQVVVRVEVVPGTGEVTPEMVEAVIEFTETTEAPVFESVTGEPFVPDDTTTEPEEEEDPEPGDQIGDITETLTVERAGGLDEFTFEADANSILFGRVPVVTPADPEGPCLRVSIVDEVGSFIGGGGCLAIDGTTILDRMVLELGGTYTVVFDPDADATGSVQVALSGATDEEGEIAIDGATETATIDDAGAISRLSFEADAGDAIFVTIPRVAPADPEGPCLRVSIVNEDGAFFGGGGCLALDGSTFIDRTELPEAGTYFAIFDADSSQTGSVDIQIADAG